MKFKELDVMTPWRAVILGCICIGCSQGARIVTFPSDYVGKVGDNANFSCIVDVASDQFEWRQNDDVRIFYSKDNYISDPNKFGVTGTYVLTVKDLGIQDGGRYKCFLFDGDAQGFAYLTVFEPPQLTVAPGDYTHGDVISVTCEATFGTDANTINDLQRRQAVKVYTGNDSVELDMTVTRQVALSPYSITARGNHTVTGAQHGSPLVCVASTQEPQYAISTQQLLSVRHPVTHVEVAAPSVSLMVGDQLNCSADGYPEPDISWRLISSGQEATPDTEVPGPYLELTQAMLGANLWACVASNLLNDQPVMYNFSFTVYAGEMVGRAGVDPWKVAVGVCVPLVVLIVVCVIILVLWKRKGGNPFQNSPTSHTSHNGTGSAPQRSGYSAVHSINKSAPAAQDSGYGTHPQTRNSPGHGDMGPPSVSGSDPEFTTLPRRTAAAGSGTNGIHGNGRYANLGEEPMRNGGNNFSSLPRSASGNGNQFESVPRNVGNGGNQFEIPPRNPAISYATDAGPRAVFVQNPVAPPRNPVGGEWEFNRPYPSSAVQTQVPPRGRRPGPDSSL